VGSRTFSLRIRTAKTGDSESISKLICTLSERFITADFNPRGREFLLSSMTPASIRKYIQSGYRYHVAETDNKLVGVAAVRDNTHLYHFFVAEQYQRQGIARKLWQVAMEACMAEKEVSEFTVNSSEYALEVYEKLGFVAQLGPRVKNGVVFFPMKLVVNHKL
jgi:ribosomal protein S18 acetylase RimI-like enzyme